MQYLENDMDELFRKAAEKYPLKTGMDKWEDIAPFVQTIPAAAAPAGKNKKVRNIILLTPFLLAGCLLFLLFHNRHEFTFKENKGLAQHTTSQKTTTSNNKIVLKAGIIEKELITIELPSTQHSATNRNVPGSAMYNSVRKKSIFSDGKDAVNANPMQGIFLEVDTIKTVPAINSELVLNNPIDHHVNSVNNITINALPEVTAKNLVRNTSRGFYVGLQGGLQLNQVSGQGFNKAGVSAGVIAGFRVGKKFSAETGIAWSMKRFYTDGKYFDMSKAGSGMPVNMTVLSLASSSNIFELPVSIKYDIAANKSGNWYITGGLSTYILTKETNDYLAIINGQSQNVQGNYTASKNYFSAAVQFGAGYEQNISKHSKLRIEPYIQIPLKGIGIGSVRVMTAGLHIGLTRQVHR